MMADILWKPDENSVDSSQMMQFMNFVNESESTDFRSYEELYNWSIVSPEKFWELFWNFSKIKHSQPFDAVVDDIFKMPGAVWFGGTKLNYAENLLKYRDVHPAIIFIDENSQATTITYDELFNRVSRLVGAMKSFGIEKNDRVVGLMPNIPETVIAMLAASSIGAIWSSCSPDFGAKGVLDRFKQINPKLIFCADGYQYHGKKVDCLGKLNAIMGKIPSIEKAVIIHYLGDPASIKIENSVSWEDFISPQYSSIQFEQLPFSHPLFIMYSSGTTGVPKSLVHSSGGTLLQHIKEHRLHTDLTRDDIIFYYTTCGWMMWNWLVTSLATGATMVLYDGNPMYPEDTSLLEIAGKLGITIFGTSAKYISTLQSKGIIPDSVSDFPKLRTILSTGSPLSEENFDFVYTHWKSDVQLASISGGTDIISCFALGNPILPVYKGELQSRGLGMAVDSFDTTGNSIRDAKGELVCKKAFPSMPVYFWNDDTGEKYNSAYFKDYPGVWSHGDYIEINDHSGVLIYGRSDATLNPGGVRIGTAEIYRVMEQMSEIVDSLVVGQPWENDERIILFIILKSQNVLHDELVTKIKHNIKTQCSPRHIPAKIIPVEDIPYTINGKKVEIAVKNIIQNIPVKNLDSLANPTSLDNFKNLEELQY